MHVLSGVVRKLKIAPSGAVPFGGGEIVLISGVEQSAFGFQKAGLGQPVFELRGETSRQILRYDECTLLRGSGSRRQRLMPRLGRLQIAVDYDPRHTGLSDAVLALFDASGTEQLERDLARANIYLTLRRPVSRLVADVSTHSA